MKTTKKKSFKRLFAFLMAFVMVTALAANAVFAAGSFTDVSEGDDFYENIESLYEQGIIGGFADGTFRPGDYLTRQQAAKMIALGANYGDHDGTGSKLVDVADLTWGQENIWALEAAGVVKGFGTSKEFRPRLNITRGHVAKMIALAFGLEEGDVEVELIDLPADEEVADAIRILASNGIVSGFGKSKEFRPDALVTRGQFAKMVDLAMEAVQLKVVSVSAINATTIEVTFEGVEEPVTFELEEALVHGANKVTFEYEGVEYTVTVEYVDFAVVDAEAAAVVDAAIEALPAVDELVLDDADAVAAARASYDALTEAQQDLVKELETLETAEAKIAELEDEAAEEAKAEAIELAINKINAIGNPAELTLDNEAVVAEARTAVDVALELGAVEADIVNYSHLVAAEEQIEALKDALDAKEKAIQDANVALTGLPLVADITLDNKEQVEEARVLVDAALAFDGVEESDLTNLWKLTAAEAKIAELEAEAEAEAALAAAIEAAEVAIAELPSVDEVTINDKEAVAAAKALVEAVEALDEEAVVEGAEVIAELEAKIAELEEASEVELAVESVSAINNMSIEVTFEGIEEPVVIELEEALVHGQTGVSFLYLEVEYTAELTVAYVDPAVVAAEKEAAIDAAKEAIHAIGNPVDLTLDDEAKVVVAEGLVEAAMALGAVEEDFGTGNLDHLEAARAKIDVLRAALSARDLAYQDALVAMINLPMAENITLAHKAQVEAASEAYDELLELAVGDLALTTDETEALNLWKLVAAEGKIAELLGDKEAADIAAADEVRLLILSTLKPVNDIKLADKELAEAARSAYDLLTDDQKELLAPAYAHLVAVEAKIIEIEAAVTAAEEAIVAAQTAMNPIEDVVAAEVLVDAAVGLADAALLLDADAVIENYDWLDEANTELVRILDAVNSSNTEPQLLEALDYFMYVNADLINKYREVLGTDHEVVSLTLVQEAIDQVNLYNDGANLLALLKAAPTQIVLLDLLNEYFPEVVNGDNLDLRMAYDLVNDYEAAIDGLVTPIEVADIEAVIETITNNAEAAAEVDALISALAPITLDDEDAIEEARLAYNELPEAQQVYVRFLSDLVIAETEINELKAAVIDEMIEALPGGVISSAHVDAILEAYEAYQEYLLFLDGRDNLVVVGNIENLEVLYVKALIFNLPTEVTVEDEVAIEFARDAYDKLKLEQRGEVEPNELQKLLDAELALAVLFAEEAVVAAEGSELQADVNAAQLLVTALPDGDKKDGFQYRLNVVQDIIYVATVVLSLETNVPHNYSGTNSSSYSTYTLPTTDIEWSKTGNAIDSVVDGIVTFAYGWNSRTATLTAIITVGTASDTVVFDVETDRSGFTTRIWSIKLAE